MDAAFFLTSVVPDFTRVCYSLGTRLLSSGAHFISVLIKSVATKDIAPCKVRGSDLHKCCANGEELLGMSRMPPGGLLACSMDCVPMQYRLFILSFISTPHRSQRNATEAAQKALQRQVYWVSRSGCTGGSLTRSERMSLASHTRRF